MPGEEGSTGEAPPTRAARKQVGMAVLTLGALGVVFGDIGTSPLYALQAVFSAHDFAVKPDEAGVYGIISLVFWSITTIVSIKYVTFIMRADNEGEGGIMALIALVQTVIPRGRPTKLVLVAIGIFGAALFYGDGMITPAISVLSAVEGLEIVAPDLDDLVIPIALVVLTALFAAQRFGTGTVGRLFGPVMCLWFAVLAILGIAQIATSPEILEALSPTHAVEFFIDDFGVAFLALGSVVLAVTGAEALYADMGHFGIPPIRRAWFFLVFPALTLNYLGQGSLILESPAAIDSPFFLLAPSWARVPLVLLATLATVIASQAVISGAFSVTRQAVQLGFLPRLRILHTSGEEAGQVYVPVVAGVLYVAVVALVVGFGSSEGLAAAYGIAVTGTLAIDTILFFYVVNRKWHRPLWLVLIGAAVFLTVDLAFFGANLPKVLEGGWFPLALALVVFGILMTWQRGRQLVTVERDRQEGPLGEFIEHLRDCDPPVQRVPGTAVFLSAGKDRAPLALRANFTHNHIVHESVVIVSIEFERVPHVPADRRLAIDDLGYRDDGISHVTARFGFQDEPNVPEVLRLAAPDLESEIDLPGCSYFLSKMTVVRTDAPGMAGWRKRLFSGLTRTSANPVEYFGLPADRIVTMGSYIKL